MEMGIRSAFAAFRFAARHYDGRMNAGGTPTTSPSGEKVRPAYDPGAYWNERLNKDFSLAGVGHSGVGLKFNEWAYRARRQVLLRTLKEHGIEIAGARILELAFGTGFYLDLWRTLNAAHVTGFDIAEVAVQAARERYAGLNWSFAAADIGKPLELGASAGACRLATAFDVLFHLVDDGAWNGALDNLAAALEPGGHAVVFDKFQRQGSQLSHVKRRTLEEYERALAARGFEVRSIRPLFVLMNSPTDRSGIGKVFHKTLWSLTKLPYKIGKPVGLGEAFGGVTGALLYYPELALTRMVSDGPSTKVLVARKK